MQRLHINERGNHTSIIEQAKPVLDLFKSLLKVGISIQVSPGKIENGVGSKSKSIKFKHINNETYEIVIVVNGARQEFKVFTKVGYEDIRKHFKKDKNLREWSINYIDSRNTNQNLDDKYKV